VNHLFPYKMQRYFSAHTRLINTTTSFPSLSITMPFHNQDVQIVLAIVKYSTSMGTEMLH